MVRYPRERQRKVREGCQVEGLLVIQEGPKHLARHRDNGVACIFTAARCQSLQDAATPWWVCADSARILPRGLLNGPEHRWSRQFCNQKLVRVRLQVPGALPALQREDTSFPYRMARHREHPLPWKCPNWCSLPSHHTEQVQWVCELWVQVADVYGVWNADENVCEGSLGAAWGIPTRDLNEKQGRSHGRCALVPVLHRLCLPVADPLQQVWDQLLYLAQRALRVQRAKCVNHIQVLQLGADGAQGQDRRRRDQGQIDSSPERHMSTLWRHRLCQPSLDYRLWSLFALFFSPINEIYLIYICFFDTRVSYMLIYIKNGSKHS